MLHQDRFDVEILECQRYFPIIGWGKKRMPTDRGEWGDRDGRSTWLDGPSSKAFFETHLPQGMVWLADWRIYRPGAESAGASSNPQFAAGADSEGWQYAIDFPLKFTASKGALDCVRRRLWRRAFAVAEDELARRFAVATTTTSATHDAEIAKLQACITGVHKDFLRYTTIFNQEAPKADMWEPDLGVCAESGKPFRLWDLKMRCTDCQKVFSAACARRCTLREENDDGDANGEDEVNGGTTTTTAPASVSDSAQKRKKEALAAPTGVVILCGGCLKLFREQHAITIYARMRQRAAKLVEREEAKRSQLALELFDDFKNDPVFEEARASRKDAKDRETARVRLETDAKNKVKIDKFRSDPRKRSARVELQVPCAMALPLAADRGEWQIRLVVVHGRDPSATLPLTKSNEAQGGGLALLGEWLPYGIDPVLEFSATVDVTDDRQPLYMMLQEKHTKTIGDRMRGFSLIGSKDTPAKVHHWADDREIHAHIFAVGNVSLRDETMTKQSDVSQAGVYIETCAVSVPLTLVAAKPGDGSKAAHGPTMMVQWRLEVRELHSAHSYVDFCDTCGKLPALCVCPK